MKSPRLAMFVVALVAASWSGAAPAHAEVPRDGFDYLPRTGAELLEAAADASARGELQARILLEPREYLIDRPLVLSGFANHAIEALPGPGHPVVANSGPPGPLLIVSSGVGDDSVTASVPAQDGVEFQVRGASAAAFPAVELNSGALVKRVNVTVPSSTPNVTAVRIRPERGGDVGGWRRAVLTGVQVTSDAHAPAVDASGTTLITDSLIDGGDPAVRFVDGPSEGHEVQLLRSFVSPGADAAAAIRIEPGAALSTTLASDIVMADDGTPVLIDVRSPTGSQQPARQLLRNLTLLGGEESTAIRVAGESATSPPIIDLPGVLSLGSRFFVSCSGQLALEPVVRIDGYLADGAVDTSSPTCAVTERGRRSGDPLLADPENGDFSPRWLSPLIDGAPDALDGLLAGLDGGTDDFYGQPRTQRVTPWTELIQPVDIGAVEYQPTPVEEPEITVEYRGNRGLTRLTGHAFDLNPDEQGFVTYRWEFEDGSQASGAQVTRRFENELTMITLVAIDATGTEQRTWLTIRPLYRLDQAATDDTPLPVYARPRVPPAKLAPLVDTRPAFLALRRVSARIKRSTRIPSGYGQPRRGEASIALTLSRPRAVKLVARRVAKDDTTQAVAGAKLTLPPAAGATTIRLSAQLGRARLKPGKYRISLSATGLTHAVKEQQTVTVRVVR